MKTCLVVFFLMVSSFAHAGEFTGAGAVVNHVLQNSGITPQSLNAQGLKVIRPSNRLYLNEIHALVTNNKVIRFNRVGHVEFRNPSAAATLGDVISFEVGRGTISKGQVRAVIVR